MSVMLSRLSSSLVRIGVGGFYAACFRGRPRGADPGRGGRLPFFGEERFFLALFAEPPKRPRILAAKLKTAFSKAGLRTMVLTRWLVAIMLDGD